MEAVLARREPPAPPVAGDVQALRRVYTEWERGNFRPNTDVYGPDLEWGWSEEFPDLHGVVQDAGPRSERLLQPRAGAGASESANVLSPAGVTS